MCFGHSLLLFSPPGRSRLSPKEAPREREIFIDNLLVRVHLIIEMSRPALRHWSLNSLFQVALYHGEVPKHGEGHDVHSEPVS
jgi:hypothetical protein